MNEYKKNNLSFYEVSERYIDYLKRFEDKVPNIKYETREKFICGILFNVNGNDYYAPVSSFNKPQRTNYIIKIGEYPVGSIRFSFMFPVPKSEIHRKDFSKEERQYKNLINSEYRFCKLHHDAILKKASEVYQRTVNQVPIYEMNCCDFKLLESKCKEWGREYNLEETHQHERYEEIVWGKDLEGAEDYAKDLEVAQETSRDIDEADIPNNTPDERTCVKTEMKKAKRQKQEKTRETKEKEIYATKETKSTKETKTR